MPGCSLEGHRKDAIDALQKQIDSYTAESNRLRCAQNSHVAISRLPAETLSEVFLCLVESGLEYGNTSFAAGTFGFLQVCRRWNEVAVGFPRLWVWRIPGATKAWPLFSTRSKGAPLFLTWRPELHSPARDALNGSTIPRIARLDFSGNIEQLMRLLGASGPSPFSLNASSIRFHIIKPDRREQPKCLDHLLSSSFPKLSVFDIDGFLPDPSSPIFTTSYLTSLKLHSHPHEERHYTLSQFAKILQHHPNLRELDLNESALRLTEPSGPLVPFVLPRLVDLRLHGYKWGVVRLTDLIGVSSPLRNTDILIQECYSIPTPTLVGIMKKILTMHYECPGLGHPRTTDCLTISSDPLGYNLAFDAGSRSTSVSHPTSNFKLHFKGVGVDNAYKLVKDMFPLFPSVDHVQEFTAVGLKLRADVYRRMLRKMKGILHLRLDSLDIEPVLDALGVDNRGLYGKATDMMSNHLYTHR